MSMANVHEYLCWCFYNCVRAVCEHLYFVCLSIFRTEVTFVNTKLKLTLENLIGSSVKY